MADVPSSSGYSALLNGENLVGRSVEQLLSKIQVVYLSEKRPQNDDGHNWMTIPLQGLEASSSDQKVPVLLAHAPTLKAMAEEHLMRQSLMQIFHEHFGQSSVSDNAERDGGFGEQTEAVPEASEYVESNEVAAGELAEPNFNPSGANNQDSWLANFELEADEQEGVYACSKCPKIFCTEGENAIHQVADHSFDCPDCGKPHKNLDALRRHRRLHLGADDLIHKCSCGVRYAKQNALTLHIRKNPDHVAEDTDQSNAVASVQPSVDEPFYDAEDEAPPAPKKAKMEISSQVESVPKPSVPTDASDLNENIRSGSSSSLVGEDNESPQSSQYTDDTEESRQQQSSNTDIAGGSPNWDRFELA